MSTTTNTPEKTTLQKCVDLFCSKDDQRPHASVPHVIGAFLYATDYHSAVMLPLELVDYKLPKMDTDGFSECSIEHEEKRAQKVFGELQTMFAEAEKHPKYTVLLSDLQAAADSIEEHNIYEPCEVCAGVGEIECFACGHDHECKTCKGTGDSDKVIGTEKPYSEIIQINAGKLSVRFNPNMITNTVKLFTEALNVPLSEHVIFCAAAINKTTLVIHGETRVLLMPNLLSNDPKAEVSAAAI